MKNQTVISEKLVKVMEHVGQINSDNLLDKVRNVLVKFELALKVDVEDYEKNDDTILLRIRYTLTDAKTGKLMDSKIFVECKGDDELAEAYNKGLKLFFMNTFLIPIDDPKVDKEIDKTTNRNKKEENGQHCEQCGAKLSNKVVNYCRKNLNGKLLCYDCQQSSAS